MYFVCKNKYGGDPVGEVVLWNWESCRYNRQDGEVVLWNWESCRCNRQDGD
jgi:hypothetical protein